MKIKPKLLLHSCCGPCSTVCVERLMESYDVTVYYYNPCIYPKEEYDKRLEEEKRFLSKKGIVLIEGEYNNKAYEDLILGHEQDKEGQGRCEICFRMRLESTAKFAKQNGFEYFTTTLSVSPHKNTQLVNKIGLEIAKNYDISFLEENFKKQNGYLRSIEISKEYNLYRQNYCGCKYSRR